MKARVQTSISCDYVKMDAFCLRVSTNALSRSAGGSTSAGGNEAVTAAPVQQGGGELMLSVMPNPVVSSGRVSIASQDAATPVSIRIYRPDGSVLGIRKAVPNSTFEIQTDSWSAGVYFIEALQGQQRKVVKIMRL